MPVLRTCVRLLLFGVVVVFISTPTHASLLDYNFFCTVSLGWVGPGTLPAVSYSGSGTGSTTAGVLLTGLTITDNYTATRRVTQRRPVSGSVLTLSNTNRVPFTDNNNVPIGGLGPDLPVWFHGRWSAGFFYRRI